MRLKKNHNLPLDKFINLSLYDRKFGYYMKKNPFGREGDFITAPNISRLFSEMIAIWVVSFWQSLGSPKKFNLIELGAGNGEMMKILIETFKNLNDQLINSDEYKTLTESCFTIKNLLDFNAISGIQVISANDNLEVENSFRQTKQLILTNLLNIDTIERSKKPITE